METTNEEKNEVRISHHEVTRIKEEVMEMKGQVAEIYIALMGSTLTKDGGLVLRIVTKELEIKDILKRIDVLEAADDKKNLLISIIWGAAGMIVSALVVTLINQLTK